MIFLFSGEGPTDMGGSPLADRLSNGGDFLHGPMAMFADKLVENLLDYSPLDFRTVWFAPKAHIANLSKIVVRPKSIELPGRKIRKETRYFYKNAKAMASCAKSLSEDYNGDNVIAVLFRDGDGTASSDRGEWDDKWTSIERGFTDSEFDSGVPMVPKPKSEAWIICALKDFPYQHCGSLENRSGNDNSPNSLKSELAALMPERATRTNLNQKIVENLIDPLLIDIPSFLRFRNRLEVCLQQ